VDTKTYVITQLTPKFGAQKATSFYRILAEDIHHFIHLSKPKLDTLIQRIISDEPIQYVTGVAPFYGYFFQVDPHVLIPRPETEELVYAVETYIKKKEVFRGKVLDVGTGSGCIPITLSRRFPHCDIIGLDVSDAALNIAQKNNLRLNTNVQFVQLDFLDASNWDRIADIDILVCNPPYIPTAEKTLMAKNVLNYEPHLALFVEDEDPLLFYRTLYTFAQEKDVQAIFLECNEYNASKVADLFHPTFLTKVIKDLQGKDRIVHAWREPK